MEQSFIVDLNQSLAKNFLPSIKLTGTTATKYVLQNRSYSHEPFVDYVVKAPVESVDQVTHRPPPDHDGGSTRYIQTYQFSKPGTYHLEIRQNISWNESKTYLIEIEIN